jgi:ubiquitin conjugation factor E4 B
LHNLQQIGNKLGDIPEEFEDPTFVVLLCNPVLLPCGKVIDLNQIKMHLLNDQTNPYTRQPLEIADVVHLKELQVKVIEFLDEKFEKYQKIKEE